MTSFSSKIAHTRWTTEEVDLLKSHYVEGLSKGKKKRIICREIAFRLRRTPEEVLKKLYRLYKIDEDLKAYKSENWSRDKILGSLKETYLSGMPLNKSSLPSKLRFILLKVCKPNAPEHRCFFESQDHALAEAILLCGYARTDDGTLDVDYPIQTLEDALDYVKAGIKKRHEWTLEEVQGILRLLHQADFPITLPFLTNHYEIYKKTLKTNRKLESFKDVIKKFINDGSIKSYADLICSIAPNYREFYNEDYSRLKLSTEEIRVKLFLDRWKIPYIIPRLSDKLETSLESYQNFVPDFIITDNLGNPKAIVEVFGSIGDRTNADVNAIYEDKTKAKIDFYNQIPDMSFVEIWNNSGKCDLDDDNLFTKFTPFISRFQIKQNVDLENIITDSTTKVAKLIDKFGCAIVQESSSYNLITARQNFKFDSLMEIPTLTTLEPNLKRLLDMILYYQKLPKYTKKQKFPGEHTYDYQPSDKDITNDSNRQLSIDQNSSDSGIIG